MTNIKIIFFDLKLTTRNLSFIHTFSCWNNKHGNVKGNVSCASSRIHLLSIFEKLGQKLEVLLSFFCGTKITLEWITPLFLDLPPIISYPPINVNFLNPPLFSIVKPPYPPSSFVTRWVQTMVQSFLCKHKCKALSFEICLSDPVSPMCRDHDVNEPNFHELTQLVQHKSYSCEWINPLPPPPSLEIIKKP